MKALTALAVGSCALVMAGCTRVYHAYSPHHPANTSLPIEVTLTHKPDQVVDGTVYYRPAGHGSYQAMPMSDRANQLWAVLPTENYGPDERLEYYLDVSKEGKPFAFGSPANPYEVTFLDRTGLILTSLMDQSIASDADHPVVITLYSRGQPIDPPTVIYEMPGVPGEIRAAMQADDHGNYSVTIPRRTVRAGAWQYAIEVPLNGRVYRRPERGFRRFTVERPEYASVNPRRRGGAGSH